MCLVFYRDSDAKFVTAPKMVVPDQGGENWFAEETRRRSIDASCITQVITHQEIQQQNGSTLKSSNNVNWHSF